ncbi:MAG: HD domain-containing protein [Motiliproteus sp.]
MPHSSILKALSFASVAHTGQRRKGDQNSPYINHLIEVAYLLEKFANEDDPLVLQAAILHDVLEDTPSTEKILRNNFDPQVVSYVLELTDDKSLPLKERRAKQIEHVSQASMAIKRIKLADHCSNIASIPPAWDRQRVVDYLSWSSAVAEQCYGASNGLADEYIIRLAE